MISVIIPTYKNKGQFLANLKHNLPYLKEVEIIVVNDNPEISLKNDLKQFKNIILLENKKNLGFADSMNKGVAKAKNSYLMFLNDDVLLQNNSYLNTVRNFKKDKKLFAVSFAQKEKDGNIVGKNIIYWGRGLVLHKKANDLSFGKNGWAEGGASLVDKQKFQELGGFDPIYSPFYWEDIDLSYRAWKSGYSILFDPSITVVHHHESTIGAHFDKRYVNMVAFRNQFLFVWKNIVDINLILSHWILLPFNLLYYLMKEKPKFLFGFIKALSFLNSIKKGRYPRTDKEVLDEFI